MLFKLDSILTRRGRKGAESAVEFVLTAFALQSYVSIVWMP